MYETDMYPTLFWNEIKFKVPKKPLPLDTKVIVWDGEKEEGQLKRHFKRFAEDGRIICFPQGKTSWTTHDVELKWEHWEVEE